MALSTAVGNMKINSEGGTSSDVADPLKWVFQDEHIIGNGSFGVVYQAVVQGSQPQRVR
jgi:hypothetical protein